MGGNGILIIKKGNAAFTSPSNERYSFKDVKWHLRRIVNGEFSDNIERDQALIEERIYPSSHLVFKYAAGLPDIRVFCLQSVPVMAMIRYSTELSRGRANLSQGAVGMGINMLTGEITHLHSKIRLCDIRQIFSAFQQLSGSPCGKKLRQSPQK